MVYFGDGNKNNQESSNNSSLVVVHQSVRNILRRQLTRRSVAPFDVVTIKYLEQKQSS